MLKKCDFLSLFEVLLFLLDLLVLVILCFLFIYSTSSILYFNENVKLSFLSDDYCIFVFIFFNSLVKLAGFNN